MLLKPLGMPRIAAISRSATRGVELDSTKAIRTPPTAKAAVPISRVIRAPNFPYTLDADMVAKIPTAATGSMKSPALIGDIPRATCSHWGSPKKMQ